MNTTNKETLALLEKWRWSDSYEDFKLWELGEIAEHYQSRFIKQVKDNTAKDNKHREVTREIVEGMPWIELECFCNRGCYHLGINESAHKTKDYQKQIKDKYNLNSPR